MQSTRKKMWQKYYDFENDRLERNAECKGLMIDVGAAIITQGVSKVASVVNRFYKAVYGLKTLSKASGLYDVYRCAKSTKSL